LGQAVTNVPEPVRLQIAPSADICAIAASETHSVALCSMYNAWRSIARLEVVLRNLTHTIY
jgi:hypothetical protein